MRSARLTIVAMVAVVLAVSLHAARQIDPNEIQLQAAINKQTIEGDLKGAINGFQKILNTSGVNRSVAARALLHLGQCHEKLGTAEARRAYERVLKDYADQPEVVRQARARLATLAKVAPNPEDAMQGRLVIGPAYHLRGVASPDGRYIAYCCMVVHEVATGRERQVSANMAAAPRFSPDSENIAYVAQESGAVPELRVVKRTGVEDRLLFKGPDVRNMSLFDWTADGKHLLVRLAREDKTTEMALVPVAGGSPRRVKSPAPCGGGPDEGRLSPDGRYFAYRTQAEGTGGAWTTRVLALDGSFDAPLVERPANAWNIGWTRDGRFAFYSAEPYSEGIWAVKVAEGKAQGLPERAAGKLDDSIRPVGLTPGGAFFYQKRVTDLQVHLMTIAPISGTLKPSHVLNAATAPGWSPDGRYLAYAEAGTGLIVIRTLATGATRTLWTGLPGAIMALEWLPDLKAIAAQGVGPDGTMASIGLRRVDLASGSLSDILLGPAWGQFGANATFSEDEKVVTYKTSGAGQVSSLVRHNLETRQQETLLERKPPAYVSSFSMLPRTGQIAVTVQEVGQSSSLGVLDPASRELRLVHRTPQGVYIPASVSLAWMPDGKSLLFVTAPGATKGTPMSLFRIPVSGGQPEKLFEAETIFQVRVHPDGSQVALDTRSYKMETRAVDNLFSAAKK